MRKINDCCSWQEATEDDDLMGQVQAAAQGVTDALNILLQQIRDGARIRGGGPYDDNCDDILHATDRLFNSMGNAGEMVKQAKILAQVCCAAEPYCCLETQCIFVECVHGFKRSGLYFEHQWLCKV